MFVADGATYAEAANDLPTICALDGARLNQRKYLAPGKIVHQAHCPRCGGVYLAPLGVGAITFGMYTGEQHGV